MGVPGLFRWVRRRVPTLIEGVAADPDKPDSARYFDHVYLDFNGCVHGSLDHTQGEESGSVDESAIEEAIFLRVEAELSRLLRCVVPTLVLYVGLDGVAPRSKANQQRTRRYRSAMERDQAGTAGKGFDRNAITAGTPFMGRLTLRLKEWAKNAAHADERLQGVNIIISGDDSPGEGEHKIMDAMRKRNLRCPGESHCILGADGDLLLLGLASEVEHFYLLREQYSDGGHTGTYDVLRLAALREYLTKRFSTREASRVVEDFLALCCLAGNDFLPALPPCRLDTDAGLDRVLAVYEAKFAEWGEDAYLIEVCPEEPGGRRLAWSRWQQVFEVLADHEQELALESMGLGMGKPPKDPPGGHPAAPDERWDGLTCLLTNVPSGTSPDELRRSCQPDGTGIVEILELAEDSDDGENGEEAQGGALQPGDNGNVACALHGKFRRADCLFNDGTDQMICAPGLECKVSWMRPGDWMCSSCRDVQFARNTKCRKCGKTRAVPQGLAEQTVQPTDVTLQGSPLADQGSLLTRLPFPAELAAVEAAASTEFPDVEAEATEPPAVEATELPAVPAVEPSAALADAAVVVTGLPSGVNVEERSKGRSKGKGKRQGKGKGKGKGKQKGSWGDGDQRFIARFETAEDAVKALVRGPRRVKGSRIVCSAHVADEAEATDAPAIWRPLMAAFVIESFEYWLGPTNLPNDRFLRHLTRLAGEDRFVPIQTFLKFAKMRSVCQDPEKVAHMLQSSQQLEVRCSTSGLQDDRVPSVAEWEVRGIVDHSGKPSESAETIVLQQALVAAMARRDRETVASLLTPSYYGGEMCDAPVAAGVPASADMPGRASCWSRAYMRGIEWVLRYYTGGVTHAEGAAAGTGGTASWHWFYPAHYPPRCADVGMVCSKHDEWSSDSSEAEAPAGACERQRLSLSVDGPLSPDLFLLSVLPPQSARLLPSSALQEFLKSADSPMEDCFPRTVQLRWPPGADPLKVQEHQQLVLVPFIEEARLCRDLRSRSWTGLTRSKALDATLFCESGSAEVLMHAFSPETSELTRKNQVL